MYSSEGSLFSLKTKANAQLYQETQCQFGQRSKQDRFLPCYQEKQLKPLLYQHCQCYFTDKNIVQTEEEWQNLHLCKLQGERSQELPFSLIVKNLEHLLFTFQFRIHNPQEALEWCTKLCNSPTTRTPFPLGCSPIAKALRARICPGKGHVYKTVVSFMTIHRTGRWMSPVKTQ